MKKIEAVLDGHSIFLGGTCITKVLEIWRDRYAYN